MTNWRRVVIVNHQAHLQSELEKEQAKEAAKELNNTNKRGRKRKAAVLVEEENNDPLVMRISFKTLKPIS